MFFFFGLLLTVTVFAQQTIIKGSVKDAISFKPISEVNVAIEETNQSILTDANGEFGFFVNIPDRKSVV